VAAFIKRVGREGGASGVGGGCGLARERDRHQDAFQVLLRAETLAPQRVHAVASGREAIASLLSAAGGSDLRSLARWAGVA
jgi:hypothetical protein